MLTLYIVGVVVVFLVAGFLVTKEFQSGRAGRFDDTIVDDVVRYVAGVLITLVAALAWPLGVVAAFFVALVKCHELIETTALYKKIEKRARLLFKR